ncbi:hypothetical protein, partial [Planktotalea sp.]|uniref:hypothetical protein n=1 Tax=Planktotalea sp. TaxID=2029877 RepID=UPI003299EC1B
PETAKIAIKARIKNSQLDFETDRSKRKILPKDTNFVHIARVVNPVNLLIDSFMPLAICLHVGALFRDARIMSDGGRSELKAFAMWEDGRTSKECTADLLKAKNTLKTMQNPPWKEVILDISEEEVSEYDMEILLDGSKALSETMVKNCGSYLNQICSASSPDRTLEKTGRDAASWHKIVERSQAGNATLDEIADLLRLRFRIEGSPDFDEWRNVRRTLGANRFSLTILLAAAQTLALREREIVKGAEIADQFISGVVDKVRTGSRAKRESLVLSSVLEVYRSLHVLAKPDDDYELHQLLLRHLAAIGSPTTVGVLVRLPEIRRYLTGLGEALPCSRTKFVGRAMHRLCMRGIVFRLSRHPRLQELQERKANLGDRPQFRYALHRSVQRHVMSHFGTMSTDVARANEYSPSLFASMPSGLPRLNHTSYRFLRELMLSLSQYPDIPLHAQDGEEWNFSSARRATQVQALRAALSMVRSSFSIAVVSRFEDYKDVKDAEIRKRGYFETYKVRLRWIIRKAWSLMSPERQSSARGQIGAHYRPDQEWDEVNALYRDEIVWLYNEVGLVCLVQGNLHDALGHLRQAGELNQHIEGRDEDGAMGHRISINRAICQMERGHIQAARRRLMDVRNDERDQNKGKIYYLATAHLGVCDHLLGNHERALKKLQTALSYLLSRKDFRASAVIGHQLALLYSLTDVDKARAELLNARRFAEAGGHEDVRRQIDITDVSLTIDHSSALLDTREQYIDGSKTLLSVVDYARLMGVPALECEALIVRGRLLLAQNESTAAGAVLTRAMTLAKRNGMNLRLNRAMTLYGDVLIRRRQLIAAERLLYGSLEKAKNSQFRTEVSRIHRLLDQLRTMYSAV